MLTGKETRISTQYHQVKIGGDIAVMLGICKHVFAADDKAKSGGKRGARCAFHRGSTRTDLKSSRPRFANTSWDEIEAASGLTRAVIEVRRRSMSRPIA